MQSAQTNTSVSLGPRKAPVVRNLRVVRCDKYFRFTLCLVGVRGAPKVRMVSGMLVFPM